MLGPDVELPGDALRFGIDEGDLRAERLELRAAGSRFTVDGPEVELRVPGRHNVLNALAALAACRAAGSSPPRRPPRWRASPAPARRFEEHGRPPPARSSTTTTRTTRPRCGRRSRRPARSATAPGRLLPAAPLLAHARSSRASSAGRSPWPTWSSCSTSTPRASGPRTSRGERPAGRAGGGGRRRRPAGLVAAALADAERMLTRRARDGDLLVTLGAGDVDGLARGCGDGPVSAPAGGVERDHPLARLTTIRTGGPADFARPAAAERAGRACRLGRRRADRGRSGRLGSNLLIADEGFRGLVMKLDGALATIEQRGRPPPLRRRRAPARRPPRTPPATASAGSSSA